MELDGARQWIKANVRARVSAPPNNGTSPKAAPPSAPPSHSGDDDAGSGAARDYWESRARREAAEADMAEWKAAELRKELIRASAVERAEEKKAAAVRETALQWPAQLAPVLAAEADTGKCYDILLDAVMQLLGKISGRSHGVA
jgi:hypothetical protein